MIAELTQIKITGIDVVPDHDPYHRGQCRPTSTVLKIYSSKTGEPCVCISQEMDQGATPSDEWHGRTLTVSLERGRSGEPRESRDDELHLPDAVALREYLESEAGQILLGHITDGHSVEWDGNNMSGNLSSDGNAAFDELLEAIGGLPHHEWQLWNTEDWLYESARSRIDADTTDEQIKNLAAEIETEAEQEHIVLDGDIEEYLTEYRNEKRPEVEEE